MESKIKKIIHDETLRKAGLIAGLVVFGLGLFVFIFNFTYKDKTFPQTFIGGINVGGKSRQDALKILQNDMYKSDKSEVQLKYQDQNWVISAEDLKISYQVDASVNLAWQVGREGSFGKIAKEQLKSIFGGNLYEIIFNYDKNKLNEKLLDIAGKTDILEKDATIKIEDLNPVVVEEQEGQKLNLSSANDEVLHTFGNLKPASRQGGKKSEINLEVDKVLPKVKAAAAQVAAGQVKDILSNSITLRDEKKEYVLQPKDIAPWLDFIGTYQAQDADQKIDLKKTSDSSNKIQWSLTVVVNDGQLDIFVEAIAGEINQEPKDAKFQVEDGKVAVFQTSQTGYSLDRQKAKDMVSQAILGNKKIVDLPVTIKQPEITSNSATSIGLVELIGEGTTSWRGSPSNRIHNLSLGAEKLSGIIVKPGEEFSTVKGIGEIGPSTGFLPELVIKNSTQVVPDYGGGLCQVSTTLFRAVLNSGLEITDRTPHSFRVSYYEPPVGMDATIYDPAPDFKFVNNYDTPILIWGIAGNNSLTFQIYGTKDDRKIEISDPWVGDYVSPGSSVYQESDSMEPGTIRQVEKALQGCTASFTYKVTSASGEVLQKETFVSKYVALSNSYLVGPGYETPPPEEAPAEEGQ